MTAVAYIRCIFIEKIENMKLGSDVFSGNQFVMFPNLTVYVAKLAPVGRRGQAKGKAKSRSNPVSADEISAGASRPLLFVLA